MILLPTNWFSLLRWMETNGCLDMSVWRRPWVQLTLHNCVMIFFLSHSTVFTNWNRCGQRCIMSAFVLWHERFCDFWRKVTALTCAVRDQHQHAPSRTAACCWHRSPSSSITYDWQETEKERRRPVWLQTSPRGICWTLSGKQEQTDTQSINNTQSCGIYEKTNITRTSEQLLDNACESFSFFERCCLGAVHS